MPSQADVSDVLRLKNVYPVKSFLEVHTHHQHARDYQVAESVWSYNMTSVRISLMT